jgi:PAS domain S-box-containing protein
VTPHDRSRRLFHARLESLQRDAHKLFKWLLLAQWLLAIGIALVVSPYAWAGRNKTLHVHLQSALFFGALLNTLPWYLIRTRPSSATTRHVVALAQVLWSALLIDLTGGRIETHFHVFVSLAFLAIYRDGWILLSAAAAVALDHLLRGLFWPEAIYGSANPEWWRFLEHASWVVFEVAVLIFATRKARIDMMAIAEREAALQETQHTIEREVQLRTRELGDSLERYRALVENTNAIPWEVDSTGSVLYIAPQAPRLYGCSVEELHGRFPDLIHPEDRERVLTHFARAMAGTTDEGDNVDYRLIRPDGTMVYVRAVLAASKPGQPLRGITIDITKEVKLQGELRQAQKLESIGKLAAGVAHEINTPVQFVNDSVHFVKSASEDLFALLHQAQRVQASVLNGAADVDAARAAEQLGDTLNLAYLHEQVPRALGLALEGLDRVAAIVRSMREFAYPHAAEMASADLNKAIANTLVIARGEYKPVAELETDLGELPPVRCHVGDINQVVLNIVVNAAHAIAAKKSGEPGRITVRTRAEGDHVVIAIGDTGVGIPEHARERVYDPFFTTKEVGSGTGQGLSISHTVVVERHRGALWFESRVGVGTTFFIRLPVAGQQRIEKPAA